RKAGHGRLELRVEVLDAQLAPDEGWRAGEDLMAVHDAAHAASRNRSHRGGLALRLGGEVPHHRARDGMLRTRLDRPEERLDGTGPDPVHQPELALRDRPRLVEHEERGSRELFEKLAPLE